MFTFNSVSLIFIANYRVKRGRSTACNLCAIPCHDKHNSSSYSDIKNIAIILLFVLLMVVEKPAIETFSVARQTGQANSS